MDLQLSGVVIMNPWRAEHDSSKPRVLSDMEHVGLEVKKEPEIY